MDEEELAVDGGISPSTISLSLPADSPEFADSFEVAPFDEIKVRKCSAHIVVSICNKC